MEKEARASPGETGKVLKQGHAALGLASQKLRDAFGLQIPNELLNVHSRVLTPPRGDKVSNAKPNDAFLNAAVLAIRDGDANDFKSLRDIDFAEAVKLLQAVLVHKGVAPSTLNDGMIRAAVLDISLIPEDTPSRSEATRLIKRDGIDFLSQKRSGKPSILFVFLSKHDEHIRASITAMCDIKLGIQTVFLDSKTMRKALSLKRDRIKAAAAVGAPSTPQTEAHIPYLFSVALRANAKLGARNFRFSTPSGKMFDDAMFVGISTSAKQGQPAVVAVVASRDGAYVEYPATIRWQEANRRVSTFCLHSNHF